MLSNVRKRRLQMKREMSLDTDWVAMISVIARIWGYVICLISSLDYKKALTRESKIFASISWLTLTAVRDFRTRAHICDRYFVFGSYSLKWLACLGIFPFAIPPLILWPSLISCTRFFISCSDYWFWGWYTEAGPLAVSGKLTERLGVRGANSSSSLA